MFDFGSLADKGLIIVQSENSIAIKSIHSKTPFHTWLGALSQEWASPFHKPRGLS